jgi:hypothetical protein
VDGSPLTFRAEPTDPVELEIRVNFGVFSGREATNAEIDELARDLLEVLERVSIVTLRRHEFEHENEASIHQVKVEARPADALPGSGDAAMLPDRLLELVDAWAHRSIELRHAEVAEVEALPEPVD